LNATAPLDVAIIGGGPAGSCAGTFLARSGLRVGIFEKTHFPRFSVGESLLPYGNDILRELGVWPKLEAAGFMPKYGAEFCTGDRSRTQRFWFARNLAPQYEHSFQVERATFDKLLLDHAREAGCAVTEGARVTSIDTPDEPVMALRYVTDSGENGASARWVIDASGRGGLVGHLLGWKKTRTQPTRRMAIYGHFRGVFRNAGKAAGHITIVRLAGGWFWLIPLDAGKTSVGLVLPVQDLYGRNPADAFDAAIAGSAELRDRMRGAERIGVLHTTGDYSWRFPRFSTRRILLAGDAAGFVDPIFSSGVLLALKSGKLAARSILRADARGRGLSWLERRHYRRSLTRGMSTYSRLIRDFYDRAGFEVFMNPSPVLDMPVAVAHLVGGNTDLTGGLLAKLWAFHALCRLQRVLRIAPRLFASTGT